MKFQLWPKMNIPVFSRITAIINLKLLMRLFAYNDGSDTNGQRKSLAPF